MLGLRERVHQVRAEVENKTKLHGWALEKQDSSWAPAGTWSNVDLDITPVERRT